MSMSPVNEWVAAQKALRKEFGNKIISVDYAKAKISLAKQYIDKYPDTLGSPDVVGRGTPRAEIIECERLIKLYY